MTFHITDEIMQLQCMIAHLEALECWYTASLFREEYEAAISRALSQSVPTKKAA